MMKNHLFILALVAFFWLTGCQSRNVEAQSVPTPMATPVAIESPQAPREVDHCAQCHTDQEQLIFTAKPEEIGEKESSGAG